MAQTKRTRQTKHRGNAAGIVESRGRTSRPPSASERKAQQKAATRTERLMKKPTWRSSWIKAAFAGIFIFVFVGILSRPKNGGNPIVSAILMGVIAVLLFGPANYYLETLLWKRRMNPPASGSGGSGGLFGGFGRKK
jgi:hypothetical protein